MPISFKIWHYAKGLVHKQDYKELFAVRWRPTPTKSYDVRPISPVPKEVAQAAAGKLWTSGKISDACQHPSKCTGLLVPAARSRPSNCMRKRNLKRKK